MTGAWTLPMQAELGGVRYAIRTDYRDVLELLRWLGGSADPAGDGADWFRRAKEKPANVGDWTPQRQRVGN